MMSIISAKANRALAGLGDLLASGVTDTVPQDSWIARIVGGLIAALATLGYSASRAKVKSETGNGGSA